MINQYKCIIININKLKKGTEISSIVVKTEYIIIISLITKATYSKYKIGLPTPL